jgi:hypothetical protein
MVLKKHFSIKCILLLCLIIFLSLFFNCGLQNGKSNNSDESNNTVISSTPPSSPVKLIFIHHSCGENWLRTGNGDLGSALNLNNYYVSDTNYGWDAESNDNLGDRTDTIHWPEWFTDTKMPYVYSNNSNSCYTNTITNPGGENEIIMFKSCYPNSDVGSSIDDEKDIYNPLLTYFSNHTNKIFVLIVPPPMQSISTPSLTRELANWLSDTKNGWLKNYTSKNVFVFDFYNILTDPDNHHWVNNDVIEHVVSSSSSNVLYYFTGGDNHPNSTGNQKATSEFVPLLNAYYNIWKGL